jgi:hypothetical protein
MLRKFIFNYGLVTDGCLSVDPTNDEIIQGVYKKKMREGEERLMLAVLESAVEDFQKYVLARSACGKKLFREAEEWFLDKDSEALSRLRVSVKPCSYILTTYGRACCSGRRRGSKRLRPLGSERGSRQGRWPTLIGDFTQSCERSGRVTVTLRTRCVPNPVGRNSSLADLCPIRHFCSLPDGFF